VIRLLTGVPAVLLCAALTADLAGVALRRPALWSVAAHLALAGVVLGVLGAAAWLRLSGRSGWRGLALALALALFALARWVRGHPAVPPDPPVIGAEVIGIALLALAHGRPRPHGAP
jgi:uncharacterized membrane protein